MLVVQDHSTADHHTAALRIALRRAAAWLRRMIDAALRARRIWIAEKQLVSLDSRLLADIGISRADIADVVRDGRLKVDISGTVGLIPSDRAAVEREMERLA